MAPQEEETAPLAASAPPAEPSERASAPPVPVAQLPAVIGGKYRPIRLIAKGGMGAVYEVEHANTGERLALKLLLARSLLTPELVERFRREARIHSAVKDEHVVRVIDADVAPELDDTPFLVMELLQGKDLERVCLDRRPSPEEVADWMRQLAGAMDRAHQEGIVHRDLKPENLFLAERAELPPIVKILDFGIAKVASETDGHSTATGQILGTPRYMAPEQAFDAKQTSAAADRFALGLIAFRLLFGRHYFTGDNWVRQLQEVARGPRARPSAMGCACSPSFDAWFARACAFEPRDRFPTCAEQVDALARALDEPPARPGRWRRARPWAVAGGICGLAAAWAVARAHQPASRGEPGHGLAAPAALVASPAPRPPTITTGVLPEVASPAPTPPTLEVKRAGSPAAEAARTPEPRPPGKRWRSHGPSAGARTPAASEAGEATDPYADQK